MVYCTIIHYKDTVILWVAIHYLQESVHIFQAGVTIERSMFDLMVNDSLQAQCGEDGVTVEERISSLEDIHSDQVRTGLHVESRISSGLSDLVGHGPYCNMLSKYSRRSHL